MEANDRVWVLRIDDAVGVVGRFDYDIFSTRGKAVEALKTYVEEFMQLEKISDEDEHSDWFMMSDGETPQAYSYYGDDGDVYARIYEERVQ